MQKSKLLLLYLFAVLSLVSQTALTSPTTDLDLGAALFNRGEYAQAAVYFELADSKVMQSPLLTNNLGSVYYRLGQFNRSKIYYTQLTLDKKYAALAYCNLALIEHKIGTDDSAIELFEICQSLALNEQLRSLAGRQIDMLRRHADKP